jgi:hypothetical protein
MSITETAQTDTGFTDGSPADVVNKLHELNIMNIDTPQQASVQGGLVARLDGCTARIPGRDKNATLTRDEILNGWSVPDPASTQETPLPDIVVTTGMTATELQEFRNTLKVFENLFRLKHDSLRELAHNTGDVFA